MGSDEHSQQTAHFCVCRKIKGSGELESHIATDMHVVRHYLGLHYTINM